MVTRKCAWRAFGISG